MSVQITIKESSEHNNFEGKIPNRSAANDYLALLALSYTKACSVAPGEVQWELLLENIVTLSIDIRTTVT